MPRSAGSSERATGSPVLASGALRRHADQLRAGRFTARYGLAFVEQHAREAAPVDAAGVDAGRPRVKLRLVARVVAEDHVRRTRVEGAPQGAGLAIVAPFAMTVDGA